MKNKADNLRFFEDMAKIAGGAIQSMGDLKGQIKSIVKTLLGEMDIITRDEFERVEGMAKKARERQLELEKRLLELEKKHKTKAVKKPVKKTVKKAATPARKKKK